MYIDYISVTQNFLISIFLCHRYTIYPSDKYLFSSTNTYIYTLVW